MPIPRLKVAIGAALIAVFVGLLATYVGRQVPLTQAEVDLYLERIQNQTEQPGGQHDLDELRRFLQQDDGKPFYTVNLYAFYEQAQYSDGRAVSVSGREAFERFSEVMIRLLARRASHPVFGSDWADAASSGWDRIVIVRYRSRRDFADLFCEPGVREGVCRQVGGAASQRPHARPGPEYS